MTKKKQKEVRPVVMRQDESTDDAVIAGLGLARTEQFACRYCKHYIDDDEIVICTVYPLGIPLKIWEGDVRHVKPYPGDEGVQFELRADIKRTGVYK